MRRLRKLAPAALADYGLADARIKLVRHAGNSVYRIFEADPAPAENDLYLPGQYLLRVHMPDYQATDALELELAWLAALRRDANLPVQQPVPTLDGKLHHYRAQGRLMAALHTHAAQ